MGISKSGRATNSAPNHSAVAKLAAGLIAGMLATISSASSARAEVLSPFPELSAQDNQAATAPTTMPADTASTTIPAATAPSMAPLSPSTAPFLPSPPERRNQEPADVGRTVEGEIVSAEPTRGPLTFSFTGLYMYGPVKGLAQTPLGGKQSSTNLNRPSFSAGGIDTAQIGDGELAIGLSPHQQVFFGAQYIHMSGDGVLTKSLISDNINFPARTHVHTNLRMDWYRFGYRYTFALDTAPNNVPDFTVTPFIDGFYWDYGFSMNGGRIGRAARTLTKFGVQIGATVAWRPNGGPLSIELSAAGFPQVSQLANIAQESILARYRFYHYRNYDFNVLLGVAFEQQTLKDSKFPVPNKVNADFGPMLLTGLQVNF
jgi:hypothetical protein